MGTRTWPLVYGEDAAEPVGYADIQAWHYHWSERELDARRKLIEELDAKIAELEAVQAELAFMAHILDGGIDAIRGGGQRSEEEFIAVARRKCELGKEEGR